MLVYGKKHRHMNYSLLLSIRQMLFIINTIRKEYFYTIIVEQRKRSLKNYYKFSSSAAACTPLKDYIYLIFEDKWVEGCKLKK